MKLLGLLNIFSCRRYSELATKRLDGTLRPSERAFFFLHHLICMVCRRFNRQITMIDSGARQSLSKVVADGEALVRLPASARERIERAIREEQ